MYVKSFEMTTDHGLRIDCHTERITINQAKMLLSMFTLFRHQRKYKRDPFARSVIPVELGGNLLRNYFGEGANGIGGHSTMYCGDYCSSD